MLSWIAVHSEHARIERDLEHRAQTVLSAAGYDWVSVAVSGRDALMVGTTDNPHDIPEVNHLVRHVWGVHRVIDRTKYIEPAAKRAPVERTKESAPEAKSKASEPAREAPPLATDAGDTTGKVPKTAAPKREPPETESKNEVPAPAPSPSQAAPAQSEAVGAAPSGAALAPDAKAFMAGEGVAQSDVPAEKSDAPAAPTDGSAPKSAASDAPAEAHPAAKAEAPANTSAAPFDLAAATPPTPPTPPEPPRPAAAPPLAAPPPTVATAPSAPVPQSGKAQTAITATLPQRKDAAAGACSEAVHAIAVTAPMLFARGSAALGRRNRTALDQLAKAAGSCAAITLKVSGHADASGLPQRNVKLAEKRASAAVSYLVARGIDAGRLTAVGYGDSRPVAPNDSASNRAKNRRIEFEVSGYREGASAEQGASNGLSHR
jgi:outer membrane protein OmpA-like peptidoglycan-associated protein